jgi:hypothetical protein
MTAPLIIALHMRNVAYALRTGAILPESAADAFTELAIQVEGLADLMPRTRTEETHEERTP